MRTRLPVVILLVAAAACRREAAERNAPLVAFLGDSLTAGWRLSKSKTFSARLESRLREGGRPIRVINAGVSGETIAQGLARLPGVLEKRPDILVVALGVNDGLRGLPLEPAEAGLRQIVERARHAGVRVLLVGMRVAPGPDPEYARRFAGIYPRVAADFRVPLVPFLLEGVAGRPELNFPDRLHPTAAGHERLAQNVRPHLEMLLAELAPAGR